MVKPLFLFSTGKLRAKSKYSAQIRPANFISISFEVIRDLIYILPYCPNELAFTLRSVRTVHYDDMVRAEPAAERIPMNF